ncbi:MAG: bifunctional (p)ppGpp synthetase/guanosine-3',5'-bis(diphosphate) 3'-pyrophosphohydrolase [Devosiaceae bacterium]|nr:bifunctional (p)ppGpp synthetase/guanosine-3',5'-bis(diphosphate) 3'-pyrophosphohydrolase [Devosiaceae bacterium MH13]
MMRQYELVEKVSRYNPAVDEALLNRAYVYAMRAHGSQKRASGDPYFSHPLEVASILTDLRLDDATIAVALLHDTIEDTEATREEIDRLFGEDIGKLVDGLTKLKKLDFITSEAKQGENLRKLFLAISDDVRVLLVKLADRVHNMRTLGAMREDKRQRIAQETMEIYAPLAGRIGMQDMRDELEDLAFAILDPERRQMIQDRLDEQLEQSDAIIGTIIETLQAKLAEYGLASEVTGRQKRAYSIYQKMLRKGLSFEQLSDLYGFRIIVSNAAACYRALGIVHTTWQCVPERFKDYISVPKENDYQSLHTTVIGPYSRRVELQIRTQAMHDVAEYGIAAHGFYKDRASEDGRAMQELRKESLAYAWLRRTVESLNGDDTAEEFLDNTKLELFRDQVFCFTPKGRVIALPRGATPIDFAYAVHTQIGDTCVGAKIDGQLMPLLTELRNGNQVEIITSKAQVPPPAWEQIARTGKARAAIRRATRLAVQSQYLGLGRSVVERAFERASKPFDVEAIEAVLPKLAHRTVEDVFTAVGRGELASRAVLTAVYPEAKPVDAGPAPVRQEGWFGLEAATSFQFRIPEERAQVDAPASGGMGGDGPPVRGLDETMTVRLHTEEPPIPGDRIVGIVTPGEGVTVYPIHARALAAYENTPERWLDVRWDIDPAADRRFEARLKATTINEPGSLAEVSTIIGKHDANIDNLVMARRGQDFHDLMIEVQVRDARHLHQIITDLRSNKVVSTVERASGEATVDTPDAAGDRAA